MKGNNMAILRGHLGAAPEARQLPGGARVVTLRVATNAVWKGETGEKRERTDWHTVEVWGSTADFCFNFLQKGDLVAVMGSIRNDVVDDAKGKRTISRINAWEVQGLTSAAERAHRAERKAEAPPPPAMATAAVGAAVGAAAGPPEGPEDDLPF